MRQADDGTTTTAPSPATGEARVTTRQIVKAIADKIEALITILDQVEPDPDLEDGDDDELTGDEGEPSLGSPVGHSATAHCGITNVRSAGIRSVDTMTSAP